MPFGALDAVLRILRDGDPPIRLRASRSNGALSASLSAESKTGIASDDG
jgi:hypothetical protein